MSKWINLVALRAAIAADAIARAEAAGIEHPRVHVRIDPPDQRGRRNIEVQVSEATPEILVAWRGTEWKDN